jgi:hypothetical protein
VLQRDLASTSRKPPRLGYAVTVGGTGVWSRPLSG